MLFAVVINAVAVADAESKNNDPVEDATRLVFMIQFDEGSKNCSSDARTTKALPARLMR